MPNRDRKGPRGKGPLSGRRGRQNRPLESSQCTCPKCGHVEAHKRALPCTEKKCPKCGTPMKGENCLNMS